VVGVGYVDVFGLPCDPDGHVKAIEVVTLQDAAARFLAQDRADLAALYNIAAEISIKERTT